MPEQVASYNEFVPRCFYDWATSNDTGISSATIFAATTGLPSPYGDDYDVPRDADDFGRCYRFLQLFSGLRPRLEETIRLCQEWQPLVEAWDELVVLYEVGLPTGYFAALDYRLDEINAIQEAQCPND